MSNRTDGQMPFKYNGLMPAPRRGTQKLRPTAERMWRRGGAWNIDIS